MRILRLIPALLSIMLPAAAQAGGVPAYYVRDCSPADQPSLVITVPQSNGRSLQASIWGARLETLASGSFMMFSSTNHSQAAGGDFYICQGDNDCRPSDVQLRIGTYKPGVSIDGDLIFRDGGSPQTLTFIATPADDQAPCG